MGKCVSSYMIDARFRVKYNTMRNKLIFFLGFTLLHFSQPSFAQQDSTLLKFTQGVMQVINKRANDAGWRIDGKPSFVIIGKDAVSIDSLKKYNIKDIESVTIQFDLPSALYGHLSELGVIILNPKRKRD